MFRKIVSLQIRGGRQKNAKIRSRGTVMNMLGIFGPVASLTAAIEARVLWSLGALAWDRIPTKPSRSKLLSLGLG